MHWPAKDGVAEEHWWIEAYGYTVETFPVRSSIVIYGPRRPDPPGYSGVKIPLAGLLQRHIDWIAEVLTNGQLAPTPRMPDGTYGLS